MFASRLRDRSSSLSRNASDSYEDLARERLEEIDRDRFEKIGRLIRIVRVPAILMAILRFGISPPPEGSDPSLNPWLIALGTVVSLSVANVLSRRSVGRSLEVLARTARIELVIDSLVTLGYVAEIAHEGRQLGIVMLLYPIMGAAARFGLGAAAATWLGTGILYVAIARTVGRYPEDPLPMGGLFWQLFTIALLGLLMALLADILMRQLQQVKRQEIDARSRADLLRIAAETGRAMTTFDSARVLDAALEGGRTIGFEIMEVFIRNGQGSWTPFRHGKESDRQESDRQESDRQESDGQESDGQEHPLDRYGSGIVEAVRTERRTMTLDMDTGSDHPWHFLREVGFGLVVGIPIWGEGDMLGVMVSATSTLRAPTEAELECLELLAAQVGAAFDAALHVQETHGLEDRLAHEVSHDRLTGLPNRAWFLDRLADSLRAGLVSVLVCDIDRFKTVNDSLGHRFGDRLLDLAAARLLATGGPKGMVARIGADEFAMELISSTSDDAAAFAAVILEEFTKPFMIDGQRLMISCSIGVASNEGAGSIEATTLLRDADLAMYQAKRAGRARYELFDVDLRARARRRMETETDLRQALAEGGLTIAYQPIVSLSTGMVVSVEALARWNHPRRGMIPPDEFIPVAEETAMIGDLGRFVLNGACSEARSWQRSIGDGAPSVAVNLSALQLGEPGCVDMVIEALASSDLPPSRLVLEITEGVMMGESPEVLETVVALADLDVRLAVDDFGKGWSSLAYLARFPLAELKIDGSFVANMESKASDRVIVASVIQLAHELGLAVVAEGIETKAQFTELVRMGCDSGQGFYLHRPLPPLGVSALFQRLVS